MSAAEALSLLCQERSIPLDVVIGPSRLREHVRLRWWCAKELASAGFGLSEIGRAMNKDHSTVLYGLRGGVRKRSVSPPAAPDVVCSCCVWWKLK